MCILKLLHFGSFQTWSLIFPFKPLFKVYWELWPTNQCVRFRKQLCCSPKKINHRETNPSLFHQNHQPTLFYNIKNTKNGQFKASRLAITIANDQDTNLRSPWKPKMQHKYIVHSPSHPLSHCSSSPSLPLHTLDTIFNHFRWCRIHFSNPKPDKFPR